MPDKFQTCPAFFVSVAQAVLELSAASLAIVRFFRRSERRLCWNFVTTGVVRRRRDEWDLREPRPPMGAFYGREGEAPADPAPSFLFENNCLIKWASFRQSFTAGLSGTA